MRQKIGIALAALVVGLLVLAAIVVGPLNVLGMLRFDRRRAGNLKVGDRAPDVELVALDGAPKRLSESMGARPLVLVFGSYT